MKVIIKDKEGRKIAEWPVREDLTVLLCERIVEKLADSDDLFFKLAFENVDQLPGIVEFEPTEKRGGKYVNGKITIGQKSAMSTDQAYADGDVMATIFHEYMHYLNHQKTIYPYRYEDKSKDKGEKKPEERIYSYNTDFGEIMEDNAAFHENVYFEYTTKQINKPGGQKYMNYPDFYYQLNSEQKEEVEHYIDENKLKPKMTKDTYQYLPSNYIKDEINAHRKTLEASEKGLFLMSGEKVKFYHEEDIRYHKSYHLSLKVEERDGLTPEGFKKEEK